MQEKILALCRELLAENGVAYVSYNTYPGWSRREVVRALILSVLGAHGSCAVMVSTGAKNEPALQLYKQLGFVEQRRRFVGLEPVEVVELRAEL